MHGIYSTLGSGVIGLFRPSIYVSSVRCRNSGTLRLRSRLVPGRYLVYWSGSIARKPQPHFTADRPVGYNRQRRKTCLHVKQVSPVGQSPAFRAAYTRNRNRSKVSFHYCGCAGGVRGNRNPPLRGQSSEPAFSRSRRRPVTARQTRF